METLWRVLESSKWWASRPYVREARSSSAVMGLQAADTAASPMFKDLEHSGYRHTEPRYATELEPSPTSKATAECGDTA